MFRFWFNPLLLFLSILTILVSLWSISSVSKKRNSPPSPPRFPLIGNLYQLGSLPHRSLSALAVRYGPLMLLHFGRVPIVIVSSVETAQEVMKTHDLVFASRPPSRMADKLLYGSRDIAFTPYDKYWRQVRRISILHLLAAKHMLSFQSVREEEVAIMVEKIHASQGVVNLSDMLINIANDIVCRVALGGKYSSNVEGESYRFREVLKEFMALLGSFPVGDFVPWLRWVDRLSGLDARAKKTSIELDRFLEQVLEDRIQAKQHLETSCFVDVLLSLNEDATIGFYLNKDSMKAIILDMFVGGTDTISTALEWMMAELIRHPEALNQVQEEVRRVVGPKESIRMEDIDQMNFMKAVIKEALRLHPPGPLIPRESTQNSQLHGYEIPARTRVFINAWAIGRDPRSWDRPEKYYPERFLNNSDLDFKGQHFQFIPFGAGRRGCLGIPFAIPTIELALANLLYHFNWEMPDAMEGEELDMTETFGLSVHKKYNLTLVARPQFH